MNSLRIARPRLACSCPPSTSTLPTAPLLRPFSSSTPALESKQKRKSRLVRKTHLARKASLTLAHEEERPDPILGHSKSSTGKEVWETSLLKSVLLDREEVWGKTVVGNDGDVLPESSRIDSDASSSEEYTPKYLNFGLNPTSTLSLISQLTRVPAVILASSTSASLLNTQESQNKILSAYEEEKEKREKLMRIVDLRNANSKGIQVENKRRIVEAFGVDGKDTGRPEVQAAILTSRIHALTTHLISQPRDIHNKRSLRTLIQKRATVLKYLRSVDVGRYETCLTQIGVEGRAVEGEVIVSKKVLREVVKGV